VQFQKGRSEASFDGLYGTAEKCRAVVVSGAPAHAHQEGVSLVPTKLIDQHEGIGGLNAEDEPRGRPFGVRLAPWT